MHVQPYKLTLYGYKHCIMNNYIPLVSWQKYDYMEHANVEMQHSEILVPDITKGIPYALHAYVSV